MNELIPLSILELDLPAPSVGGWHHYLAECGIAIVVDDIGRDAIGRADAARLLGEKRAAEQRAREIASANEAQAIEADQAFRAQLWGGVRADRMPSDARPADVMLAAARDAEPRRRSVLEDSLAGGGTTMHILEPQPVEDAS
jgi:hypothetical protein